MSEPEKLFPKKDEKQKTENNYKNAAYVQKNTSEKSELGSNKKLGLE